MATPSTYPTSNEPSFPPMPRRQSCDRCHEQKVRCITQGPDGVSGLGAIAEEDESTLGRQVLAEIPCVRCSKAGAICIFSPQLRSGRPRVHRTTSSPSSRQKRTRQASSRCSSSSPSMSPGMSPAVSQSSSPRSLPVSLAGSMDYSSSIAPSLAGSPAPIPQYHLTEHGFGDHGVIADQWLLSSFERERAQFLEPGSSSCQGDHQPQYLQLPETSSVGYQSGTGTTTMLNYLWDYHHQHPAQAAETQHHHHHHHHHHHQNHNFAEELIQINLRLHRATSSLHVPSQIASSASSSISASSPPPAAAAAAAGANEIFDASSAFISMVDCYASSRQTTPRGHSINDHIPQTNPGMMPMMMPHSSTITTMISDDDAADTSACLTILACHQLIIGAFEHLCDSFLRTMAAVQYNTPPQQQIQVTVNLIGHLINQLDRSLGSLAMMLHGPPAPLGDFYGNDHHTGKVGGGGGGGGAGGAGSNSLISAVLYQSGQRQLRVDAQVHELKRILA
ncbi:hypothetical protein QBC43DRAFT_98970 [Cladorrhinum sp. PSN259]|nr:hypothetical protein QBC43DRAFT_98970 [Cladorrhinum sp. PSN259]